MCPPPTSVIFDLDGTLVQTREASWQVFEPINRSHGLGIDAAEQFYQLFAGNFFKSLRAVCQTEALADAVTAEFMVALDEHYSPVMVPGLIDVVRAMVPHSKLAVLSSNTTAVVRRVLRGNGLEYCFAHVFGGDVEPDKATGIERFMSDAASGSGRLCRAYYDEPGGEDSGAAREIADPRRTVLITDTVGDVEAAVRSGIRAVGVAWGMHTEEQLTAAGAEFVAIWPQELLSYLYARADQDCSCTSPVRQVAASESAVVRAQIGAAAVRQDRRRRGRAALTAAPVAVARTFRDPLLAEAIRRTIGSVPGNSTMEAPRATAFSGPSPDLVVAMARIMR